MIVHKIMSTDHPDRALVQLNSRPGIAQNLSRTALSSSFSVSHEGNLRQSEDFFVNFFNFFSNSLNFDDQSDVEIMFPFRVFLGSKLHRTTCNASSDLSCDPSFVTQRTFNLDDANSRSNGYPDE